MQTDLHELMCSINSKIIQKENFANEEITAFINVFLQKVSSNNAVQRFHQGVRAPEDGRQMYPLFYIPPYNDGKKLHTLNGVLPKTHIYAANSYELEILRILKIFCKGNPVVENMFNKTKERLKTTCFGNYCSVGECFEASLVALRFLSTVFPDEENWIQTLLDKIKNDIDQKLSDKSHSSSLYYYYWLVLDELSIDMSLPEIQRYENRLKEKLEKGFSIKNDRQKRYNVIAAYIVKNLLSRLPGYAVLQEIKPYIENNVIYINADKPIQTRLF